jgi:exosortase A-associated hydrolase 2
VSDPAAVDWQLRPLPGPAGDLFVLHLHPRRRPDGDAMGVVFCAPFGEELNRTRRTVRLAAAAMAAAGHHVLLVDLHGTGDSAGDFEGADWSTWLDELQFCTDWLRQHQSVERVAYWGLRVGAALAVQAAERDGGADRLLLWQPVANGSTYVTQLLRLRLAGDMVGAASSGTGAADAGGGGGGSTAGLREILEAGRSLEVAGYTLTPAMFHALEAIDLQRELPRCPVHWVEMVAASDRPFSAPSRRLIEVWEGGGVAIDDAKITGASFWSTPEIVVLDDLVTYSGELARRWRDQRGAAGSTATATP